MTGQKIFILWNVTILYKNYQKWLPFKYGNVKLLQCSNDFLKVIQGLIFLYRVTKEIQQKAERKEKYRQKNPTALCNKILFLTNLNVWHNCKSNEKDT